jgi:alpha-glucosidase
MRPLAWHYPNDPVATDIDDQFMFGEHIMVAPVTDRGHNRRDVYLPAGKWYPIAGGEPIEGGSLKSIPMPLGTVPAFVREGAVIPLAERGQQSTQDYDKVTIRLCAYGTTASGRLFVDDGHSTDYEQGKYGEWKLSFADGKLKIDKAVDKYKPANAFALVANGNQTPLNV